MKKYIPVTLLVVLSGFQLMSGAQTAQVESPSANQPARETDWQAQRQAMQQKMAAAKTDAERQQIMTEQQQKMQGGQGMHGMQGMQQPMHGPMHGQMAAHQPGHMRGMPMMNSDMHQRRQMMQQHMSQ